ncbi:MAG: hypothetical protein HYX81_02495 [Chloroflexi bacterium]|nr:hypothetical protein [Chloroflexota bacterium]
MDDHEFIRKLMTLAKCRACGQDYELKNIDVFGHQKDLWLLALSCSACHTRYLTVIRIEEDSLPKAIADLTEAELDKFSRLDALSADEVREMRSFLKTHRGSLSELFGDKKTG